jgi:hypothetical protein
MQHYYTSSIQEKEARIAELEGYVENIVSRIEGRQPAKQIMASTNCDDYSAVVIGDK